MRAMKHSSYIMKGNAYSGTSPFTDLRAAGDEQTFNIRPGDIATDRFPENGLQRFVMF
jgi:hypothetical protein